MKRIAVIDIGTNTFNLLIVDRTEKGVENVYDKRVGVSLGDKGINNNQIHGLAFERGVNELLRFKKICDDYNVSSIFAFGTSALRNASNSNEFVKVVKSKTTIDINVLSGIEEAKVIHKGVSSGFIIETPSVIMDIGGGSTEFILANESGVVNAKSFEIGVSRINQMFDFEAVYSESSIQNVIDYLNKEVGNQIDDFKCDTLIGSSGSFETFYEVLNQIPYPKSDYVSIPVNTFIQVSDEVIKSSFQDRMANEFIIPIRVEMLPIAAIKIKWVIDKLGCKNVIISPNSLKEGAVFMV